MRSTASRPGRRPSHDGRRAHAVPVPVQSYFSGLFYEFEEPARSVLDACCGSGRIISALARHFPDIHLTGIENSESARERFHERCAGVARFVAGDLLDSRVWPKSEVDLALLGNVTLNSFTSESAALDVIRNLRDAVRPGGHAVLVAFHESSLERFVHLRELLHRGARGRPVSVPGCYGYS
ncbi:methyltransferase domain-containing protein [Streptomyces sp. NPDC005209]|uniref:class I SAM-dependent methyltransferase n=1 Tax=Streptomyces sp. NPDC005209 TaxID=3156715 RepID=UPI0033BE6088